MPTPAGLGLPAGDLRPRISEADRPPRRARRVPAVPDYWQQFWLCVGFHMTLPLLPLGAEYVATRRITPASLYLSASTYVIGIGVSSRAPLGMGVSVIAALVTTVFYGIVMGQAAEAQAAAAARAAAVAAGVVPADVPHAAAVPGGWQLPAAIIAGVFLFHLLERYNRHVVDRAPFWEFIGRGSDAASDGRTAGGDGA